MKHKRKGKIRPGKGKRRKKRNENKRKKIDEKEKKNERKKKMKMMIKTKARERQHRMSSIVARMSCRLSLCFSICSPALLRSSRPSNLDSLLELGRRTKTEREVYVLRVFKAG